MAKPKPELPPRSEILALVDGQGRLAARVTPGAREESLEIADGRLLVKVRVPPQDGRANAAVVALIARALGLPISRLEMLRGATSREKLLHIAS